MCDQDDVKLI